MKRNFLLGSLLLSSAFLATACGDDPLKVVIDDVDMTFDYGDLALSLTATKTFTVTNTGGQAVTLTEVPATDELVKAPFLFTGGTCAVGAELAKGQNCTLTVSFSPVAAGDFKTKISVRYKDKDKSHTAKEEIAGRGVLDCSITPELVAKRQSGVDEAIKVMQADAIRGKADGDKLTQADGNRDGYSDGYNQTYNTGYNDYYNSGYNDGYSNGKYVGQNGAGACGDGSSDGSYDGSSDGSSDGKYDGYNDGYSDGQSVGDDSGYDVGYSDGASSCNGVSAPKAPNPVPTPKAQANPIAGLTDLPSACYNQGYNATYSTSAYWNAYNDAKAKNVAYQTGYSSGLSSGRSAGYSDGSSAGYAAGKSVGYTDGYNYGYNAEYQRCYSNSYTSSYNSYYKSGYNNSYDSGYDSGYDDGYSDAYYDGYDDGQYDYCSDDDYSYATRQKAKSMAKAAAHPSTYGQNQEWWTQLANGASVSRKVNQNGRMVKALGQAGVDTLVAKLKTDVRGKARQDLRTQSLMKNLEKFDRPVKTVRPAKPLKRG
jgi:flagellar biosynthesis/type III secretory pathway protein FliH